MKRIHIGLRVDDLELSTRYYSALFGAEPTVLEGDYAKWMLEEPRVNFSISTRCDTASDLHLGIQVDDPAELGEVTTRLKDAKLAVRETPDVTCCYARSDKTWSADPQGIPWETFRTHGQITEYGDEELSKSDIDALKPTACCE